MKRPPAICVFFFFNDTATTEIYTLSLHDALPICFVQTDGDPGMAVVDLALDRDHVHDREDLVLLVIRALDVPEIGEQRSEEHTSELQSRPHLVCRLLLGKKEDADEKTEDQDLLLL